MYEFVIITWYEDYLLFVDIKLIKIIYLFHEEINYFGLFMIQKDEFKMKEYFCFVCLGVGSIVGLRY